MIRVEGIKKSFGENEVLKGIDFEMQAGKTNLIIGTSGSGKTVMMKCMVGLYKPDEGSVFYDDVDLITLDDQGRKEIRQQIGMLFQGSALFDSKSVLENVMFPLDMFTNERFRDKVRRVNEVLDKVNLIDVNKKFPSELSGGMKKRVALARAIVLNPKYLFCDEPNSGLDPQTSLIIDKLIHDLTHEFNMTTVVITHDMNSVMEQGEHIVYLHDGQKEWEGTSQDIIYSDNKTLNDYVFASNFFKDAKEMRIIKDKQ